MQWIHFQMKISSTFNVNEFFLELPVITMIAILIVKSVDTCV